MKIVLLCWRDTNHPEGGGSERYLERVGSYLAAQGHEVIFRTAAYKGAPRASWNINGVDVGPGDDHPAASSAFRVIRGGGNLTVYPRALAWLLWQRLRGRTPDAVVDTQNGVPFFASVISGAPTVVLTHHCHKEQWSVAGPFLSRLGWLIESTISPWVHRANKWVTVSQPSADEFIGLGVPAHNMTIIRNGVDPAPQPEDQVSPEDVDTVHIVTLSRLVPHKQIEHALLALAGIVRDYPQVRLDVVGDGWWMDKLRDYAEELNIEQYVVFHGHVSEDQKHRILNRASLHVMPSRKEGWGLAVIEAGQHGVPTVGYKASAGLKDSVIDGETGVLVENEGDFITTIEKLIENPDWRRRLGDAARRRAESFSWDATGRAWERLLRSLKG
ncbi:glycosyltransferase family 4 protein [Corynebacterium sp. 320]|uniref:glycosyltransferase family 4 protein n=1 Tax=Corynebacterium TaxID=1716 RepID=UPI00125CA841|nr:MULTISPECIES: glycosyltransferase family 4 protein [Corynebacterium]KAB1503179.1 glycosyltransferase family 4 protein [Corynebacterium sp. 320]KAB1550608.1 glycosyltransferase family 4 protein [Corynebacterium sp. 321]KAB1550969.1 glycosyltransferase family 4 protein [Corynebacterium sp. 319]KAB3526976.1 glycosyltransferase family 4 protein [Corynebacterium sp. 250]KAB3538468.1 glycosyltransferase family 4 protein [Corynebacterium sp. 366]